MLLVDTRTSLYLESLTVWLCNIFCSWFYIIYIYICKAGCSFSVLRSCLQMFSARFLHDTLYVLYSGKGNSRASCLGVAKKFNHLIYSGAVNSGRSMDNVWSELGIDWTNPWIAGHVVWSFTNLFREILIFNYLIIMRDIYNVHVPE